MWTFFYSIGEFVNWTANKAGLYRFPGKVLKFAAHQGANGLCFDRIALKNFSGKANHPGAWLNRLRPHG